LFPRAGNHGNAVFLKRRKPRLWNFRRLFCQRFWREHIGRINDIERDGINSQFVFVARAVIA